MTSLKHTRFVLSAFLILISGYVNGQYKYTRYSLDINAGPFLPVTSIPGSLSGYTEIGFKGTLSRFLAGRVAGGFGVANGSRNVSRIEGARDNVINYTKFNTRYYYFTGSVYLNLETILKLRKSKLFRRTNPYLVIGSGFMFPEIEVKRIDGQSKKYNNNLNFTTHNFGLDFRHFLSNRFDLNYGAEYVVIQSYYFDGAFSDKKLDGLVNLHVGISYNIGASADKKQMDWYNLDNQVDIIFAPEEIKQQEPISQNNKTDSNANELAVNDEQDSQQKNVDEKENSDAISDADVSTTAAEVTPVVAETEILRTDTLKEAIANTTTVNPADNNPKNPPVKKVGKYVDIRPVEPQAQRKPVVISTQPEVSKEVPVVAQAEVKNNDEKKYSSLNDVDGIISPLGKYNVIVATYNGSRYAYAYRNLLRKQGFDAALFRSGSRSKMVRVAVYYGDDRAEAIKQLNLYRSKFKGQAWIHIYNGN